MPGDPARSRAAALQSAAYGLIVLARSVRLRRTLPDQDRSRASRNPTTRISSAHLWDFFGEQRMCAETHISREGGVSAPRRSRWTQAPAPAEMMPSPAKTGAFFAQSGRMVASFACLAVVAIDCLLFVTKQYPSAISRESRRGHTSFLTDLFTCHFDRRARASHSCAYGASKYGVPARAPPSRSQ